MNSQSYWSRQIDDPLFQQAEWAKPERKSQAGKLLIIGGNGNEFQKTQESYQLADKLGVGEHKVVLPDYAKKILPVEHPDIEFAASNKTGNFSLESKDGLLGFVSWADTVLLVGELGRNNETTQIFEQIIFGLEKKLVITRDALDLLSFSAKNLLAREKTCLVLSTAQLQNLVKQLGWPHPIRLQSTLPELVENLHKLTFEYPVGICLYFQSNFVTAFGGNVSTTKLYEEPKIWRAELATRISVWWNWTELNNSLTQSTWEMHQARS